MTALAARLPHERAAGAFALVVVLSVVAITAVATWLDALLLLLAGMVGLAALAGAMVRPTLLFYMYCAAIPLNYALPPGPAGTVARIAGIAFFVGYLVRRPDSLRPGVMPIVGWLFMAWSAASLLWSIGPQATLLSLISIAQLFAITVLIASLVAATPAVVRPGLWSYSLLATATAAIGIITYLGGGLTSFGRGTAFEGQDPALFASLVLPAAIFFMGEAQARTSPRLVRLGAAASLTVCIGAIVTSGTRSAWMGMIAGTATWLVLQRDRRQLIVLAAAGVAVVALAVAVPGLQDFLAGRVASSVSSGGSGRTDIWSVGISILASAPLVGVGLGNFPAAFTPYAIAQAPGAMVGGGLVAGRAPHNVLLGMTVETGIIGAVLLALLVAAALVQPGGTRGNIVRASLVGLVVQSMFLDILAQKQLWLFLAIAFGLGAAERARTAVTGRPAREPEPGRVLPTAT